MIKTSSVDINTFCEVVNLWKWTTVYLRTMYYDYDLMWDWLNNNCEKHVVFCAAGFAFESGQDAVYFKLIWK